MAKGTLRVPKGTKDAVKKRLAGKKLIGKPKKKKGFTRPKKRFA